MHIEINLKYGTRADVSDVVNVIRRRRGGQLHRMIINLRFGRNFAVVWTRLIMERESDDASSYFYGRSALS